MSEEMLDVLNEHGQKNGQIASKKAIHQQGLWHQTVHVWVVTTNGEVLLQRRGLQMETNPGCWDISSAGHVRSGEKVEQAALREMQEEIGLTITPEQLKLLGTVHGESIHQNGAYINREYQNVYVVTLDVQPELLTMPDGEVTEFQLLSWIELQKRIQERLPEYVMHDDEYAMLFEELSKRNF